MDELSELQARVKNNQYNWDILNTGRFPDVNVDSEGTDEMVIEFPDQEMMNRYLPEFQTMDNSN